LKKLLFSFFFSCFLLSFSFCQSTSCSLRITLLTCAPGTELYSTFGHTAIRVQDDSTGTDEIYNYGTFEFAPDFYSKFIRGKLLYSLSVENFRDFLYTYQIESRSVVEQELRLSCTEKQRLYSALQVNALEENRHYRYDFLFDNCTTRARDIIAKNSDTTVVFKNILPADAPTFRDLIHSYLHKGKEYWSKLGIDILLGVKLDKKVSNLQSMFLPDYLLKGFDSAYAGNSALVTPPVPVLEMPSLLGETALFTPAIVFTILLVLIICLSLIRRRWARMAVIIFDFVFFFALGLTGLLILFMWFGTDHIVCRNNYNLLWALPTHLVAAFVVHKNKDWIRNYFILVFWLSILLTIAWFFLPQQMNNALLPVLALVIYRSWFLSKRNVYGTERNPL